MDNRDDLSSMVQKIMQNPEFTNMVKELRGEMQGQQNDDKQQSGGDKSGDISAEMMSKLPEIMSMLSPMLGKLDGGESRTASPVQKSEVVPKKYDKAKAEKLLYAIKPYLSTSRCDIIDKCVSVMQITDVMGALGGLEELMKPNGRNQGGGEGGV